MIEQNDRQLILASNSAIRASLLRNAGLSFSVIAAAIDEDAIKFEARQDQISAAECAERLAQLKARAVANSQPRENCLIIGCDQMLECDGEWFDKPSSRKDAATQLAKLAGKRHSLFSAAVIIENNIRVFAACSEAKLSLYPLTESEITAYLERAGDEVLHSVGAYQFEGLGIQLMQKVEGDYFTILGMPLMPILKYLRNREMILRE